MPTRSYNGLYYPYIHFKSDAWLKLAALYWDSMARIVPSDYRTVDSDTVRELDGAGFVTTVRPDWVRPAFPDTFADFLNQSASRLREHYGVAKRDEWPVTTEHGRPPRVGDSEPDPRLGYIFYEKIRDDVRELLVKSGVALPYAGDPKWVGMHPRLADVYMTALADEIAGPRGYSLLTDETLDHLAVSGWTFDRLAQALLGDISLVEAVKPRSNETETVAACIALRSVVPKNIQALPVERILEFRRKYPEERAVFQNYIADFVTRRDWLNEINDRELLKHHLQTELDRDLQPRLASFKKKLRDVKIDTVWGALSMQIAVPSIVLQGGALLGLAVNPVFALTAGAALALIPIIRNRQKAQNEIGTPPAAYLLRCEENLQPSQLTEQLSASAKRFRGSPN